MTLLTAVQAATPLAPYLGGKRNLSRRICAVIRSIPHRTYVEPFVGMGGVFLRRDRRPMVEVVNDLSGDVANLFRVVQRHPEPLAGQFEWLLSSRAEFERQLRVDPVALTDIERAARFIYLQRLAFGGKITQRSFGVDHRSPGRLRQASLQTELRSVQRRLVDVTIEQLPYADCIRRYDGPDTLFYLDPPYWGCEDDYGAGFSRADFECLAEQLAGISGAFILSINDTPGAREAFRSFAIATVATTYTIGTSVGAVAGASELVVTSANLGDAWIDAVEPQMALTL